jgi:hypothetical protein
MALRDAKERYFLHIVIAEIVPLGADLSLTKTLVDMGLDEFSVEPSHVLKLRSRIAET